MSALTTDASTHATTQSLDISNNNNSSADEPTVVVQYEFQHPFPGHAVGIETTNVKTESNYFLQNTAAVDHSLTDTDGGINIVTMAANENTGNNVINDDGIMIIDQANDDGDTVDILVNEFVKKQEDLKEETNDDMNEFKAKCILPQDLSHTATVAMKESFYTRYAAIYTKAVPGGTCLVLKEKYDSIVRDLVNYNTMTKEERTQNVKNWTSTFYYI